LHIEHIDVIWLPAMYALLYKFRLGGYYVDALDPSNSLTGECV